MADLDFTLPPVGAIAQKRCSCGQLSQHRESSNHPRYQVVSIVPNPWLPRTTQSESVRFGRAQLRRLDTGRVHRTSVLLLCTQYVIVSLPTEAVLING